ncbi:TAXI family TRAP transporter solute-binding subunit [Bradyrhizobium canariense]|uniref:TRAP-type uncharacterized transport system, substrate-binding protein n=1 Tax=Bradyrhizobium canariense TaxID=255045 RepID=A0A1H1NI44_9BRAD|nr:TAXI family TRAP transporter solute-binding subunit [Bradyrhizobium canariense]SDR98510.1 TRAP-type uncharacterized transport system, substrate-binding protein [Bradyrhizobium canariense]
MSRVAAVFAVIFALIAAVPADAAEFGTRDEAAAMVKRVQDKFKKDGPEATFRAINSKAPGFVDRDLYPFVTELTGLCVANGVTPAVTGKNLIDLKDQDGKFMIQQFVKTASTAPGRGWVDYRWLNPVTKTIEDKSALIERMGNYFVGVGVYRNEQPNENTIGLISGSPNSDDTYLQIAYDLADVLNDGDNLRILPIVGIGGPRNIRDVRYLRGVDIGLTQTSILNNFRRSNERMGQNDDKIVYIAKLFNEEAHLVARSNITSIDQLRGLKVNLDAKGSGTSYSMRDVFQALGIPIEEVSMSQTEAFEKVKSGEIAATVLIAGKPVRSMSKLTLEDGLHFVSIPYPQQLMNDYYPAVLTHNDYPDIVPAGQSVDTIAVGAVLIAYNWPKTNVDRYRRVQRFVEAFFPKIAEFHKAPRHPKWREVNLAATLPGWTRFGAAQDWLDSQRAGTEASADVQPGVRQTAMPLAGIASPDAPQRNDVLYQQFLQWKREQGR